MKAKRKKLLYLWAAALLMALALYLIQGGQDLKRQSLLRPLAGFPANLGAWRAVGPDAKLDKRTLELLGPQDYLLRNYVDPRGRVAALFVAYFGLQRQPHMIHSPRHCLPGAGWRIARRDRVRVPVMGVKYRINRLILEKGLDQLSVLYWYQGRGRVEDDEYLDRLHLIMDGIFRDRSDGALVRLTEVMRPDDGRVLKRQLRLAAAIIPALNRYLPR